MDAGLAAFGSRANFSTLSEDKKEHFTDVPVTIVGTEH